MQTAPKHNNTLQHNPLVLPIYPASKGVLFEELEKTMKKRRRRSQNWHDSSYSPCLNPHLLPSLSPHILPYASLQKSKAGEESTKHNSKTILTTQLNTAKGRSSSLLVTAEVGDDLVVGGLGGRGAGRSLGRGLVRGRRVLGTAGVVLSAGAGALVVLAAGGDALVSVLGAGEVGEGEGVFGDVGLLAVTADAAVG